MSAPCEPKKAGVAAGIDLDQSGAVEALAVDLHQHFVARQAAQRGARTKLDASEMVFCGTKNDGTMFLTVSSRFALGWLVSSSELITSIGDAELVTVRSVRRVPVMMI